MNNCNRLSFHPQQNWPRPAGNEIEHCAAVVVTLMEPFAKEKGGWEEVAGTEPSPPPCPSGRRYFAGTLRSRVRVGGKVTGTEPSPPHSQSEIN